MSGASDPAHRSSSGLGCSLFFFFFECCGHHRALHSFPTRRSSDLARPLGSSRTRSRGSSRSGRQAFRASTKARSRSEEHTSELQSRQYLVCRLLLEKKKNEKIPLLTADEKVHAAKRSKRRAMRPRQ